VEMDIVARTIVYGLSGILRREDSFLVVSAHISLKGHGIV
jgi:hypothetical protein